MKEKTAESGPMEVVIVSKPNIDSNIRCFNTRDTFLYPIFILHHWRVFQHEWPVMTQHLSETRI